VFADDRRVRVRHGDWRELGRDRPFDLLVLDGGGQGKAAEPPIDPAEWLRPGGVVVLDDFTPATGWPPRHDGRVDEARLYWLDHPRLRATEVRVAPGAATLVGVWFG
jgi:predicted O-methyltransferase YrrM